MGRRVPESAERTMLGAGVDGSVEIPNRLLPVLFQITRSDAGSAPEASGIGRTVDPMPNGSSRTSSAEGVPSRPYNANGTPAAAPLGTDIEITSASRLMLACSEG